MSQEIIDEKVLELIDRSLLEHPDIGYVSLEGRMRSDGWMCYQIC